jgi:hypothetical protein
LDYMIPKGISQGVCGLPTTVRYRLGVCVSDRKIVRKKECLGKGVGFSSPSTLLIPPPPPQPGNLCDRFMGGTGVAAPQVLL